MYVCHRYFQEESTVVDEEALNIECMESPKSMEPLVFDEAEKKSHDEINYSLLDYLDKKNISTSTIPKKFTLRSPKRGPQQKRLDHLIPLSKNKLFSKSTDKNKEMKRTPLSPVSSNPGMKRTPLSPVCSNPPVEENIDFCITGSEEAELFITSPVMKRNSVIVEDDVKPEITSSKIKVGLSKSNCNTKFKTGESSYINEILNRFKRNDTSAKENNSVADKAPSYDVISNINLINKNTDIACEEDKLICISTQIKKVVVDNDTVCIEDEKLPCLPFMLQDREVSNFFLAFF